MLVNGLVASEVSFVTLMPLIPLCASIIRDTSYT